MSPSARRLQRGVTLGVLLVSLVASAMFVAGVPASHTNPGPSTSSTGTYERAVSQAAAAGSATTGRTTAPPPRPAPPRLPSRADELLVPGGQIVPTRDAPVALPAGGDPVPYSQAAAALTNLSAGFEAESWALVAVAGEVLASPELIPVANLSTNCSLTWVGPPQTNIYVPATSPSAAVGTSNAYLALLLGSTSPVELLYAEVANGTATLLFTLGSTPECSLLGLGLTAIPPDVLDSPQAVTLANAAGGSAFLSEHTGAIQEWEVVAVSGAPEWEVVYSSVVGECGALFFASVDGFDGATYAYPNVGACAPPEYPVAFLETGLPTGTLWSVTLNFTKNGTTISYGTDSTNSTLTVYLDNGTYAFIPSASGFGATPTSGHLTVSGSAVTKSVTFAAVRGYYPVTFQATGLANGTWWSVELSGPEAVLVWGTTANATTVFVQNGSYSFFVSAPGYDVAPDSGTVLVEGASVTQPVVFTLIETYLITFSETGLPVGSFWEAVVQTAGFESAGETDGPLIALSAPNGSYNFTIIDLTAGNYTATPSSGSIVVDGAPTSISIVFSLPSYYYPVVFSESGLPAGSTFAVGFNGGCACATLTPGIPGPNGSETFYLQNGSWLYTVEPIYGFVASPSFGNVTVAGPGSRVVLAFSPAAMYLVTFNETGLPSSDLWWVDFGVVGSFGVGNSLAFYASNGTEPYVVGTYTSGYYAHPGSGTVDVDGAAVSLLVTFRTAPPLYPVTFTESGIPAKTFAKHGWTVELNGTVLRGANASHTFLVPNGSYPYLVLGPAGYRVSGFAPSGTLVLSGANITVTVHFVKGPTATLKFTETGLQLGNGSEWAVDLAGWVTGTNVDPSMEFLNLTPGNYSYAVLSPLTGQTITVKVGKSVLPTAGTLDVKKSTTVALRFVYPYTVTFTETGLASGNWSVKIRGVTLAAAAGAPITFNLPNGTYHYKVEKVGGYSSVGSPAAVTVSGAPVPVSVTFTAKS